MARRKLGGHYGRGRSHIRRRLTRREPGVIRADYEVEAEIIAVGLAVAAGSVVLVQWFLDKVNTDKPSAVVLFGAAAFLVSVASVEGSRATVEGNRATVEVNRATP